MNFSAIGKSFDDPPGTDYAADNFDDTGESRGPRRQRMYAHEQTSGDTCGYSSRSMSMGNAVVATANDRVSVKYNASGLKRTVEKTILRHGILITAIQDGTRQEFVKFR